MSTFGGQVSYTLDADYLRSISATARIKASAIAFLKFEEFPLVDELTQRQMVSIGSEEGTIDFGAFGNGLALRPKSIYSFDVGLNLTTELSIGFWLLSNHIEPTVNPSSGSLQFFRQPVLDKATYFFDTASGFIIPENDTFSIFEESIADGLNVMKIALRTVSTDELVVLSSSSYTTNQFHYFWFSYNGPGQIVKLYIDGKDIPLTIDQGAAIPIELANTHSTSMHINLSAFGDNSLVRGNSGLIDEVIIMSESDFDEKSIGRHINLGSEFVINSALTTRDEAFIGFGFNDPTALTLNAVYSNGKNLYLGRSDGKLFRGDRLIWEARRDFSTKEEIDQLRKNILGTDSIVEISDGALKIKQASVRLQ